MAAGISLSSVHLPSFWNLSSQTPKRITRCSFHFRTSTENEPPETCSIHQPVTDPGPPPPRRRSLFSSVFGDLSDGLKADELGREIVAIALPAALALAADPITALVDTAYVGHIGSSELAAVGVSASVFNLVSKLLNVPLLNVTTSFVAEEQASTKEGNKKIKGKKLLPSIPTSLLLAAAVGILEAIMLYAGSSPLMDLMGIAKDSSMRGPAEYFLSIRSLGAPAIVVALAAQGAFRGFKDTKTPLYAVVAGNLLNGVLDPILIFLCGFGIGGAAVATVMAEYLIAFILLWELNGKVELASPQFDGVKLLRYLTSGGLLVGRTISLLITTTLAASLAARQGVIPMAGHQICIQIWLSVSLLNDALALAGQTLLASSYSLGNFEESRKVVNRILQMSVITGLILAFTLFIGFDAFSDLFTEDDNVLKVAQSGLLFVVGSQPVNALAFVIDGLYYGISDFTYAAYSMMAVGAVSSGFLLLAAPSFGLAGVWSGLFLFMSLRVVAGTWRLTKGSGFDFDDRTR